jgi:hypothetical protein
LKSTHKLYYSWSYCKLKLFLAGCILVNAFHSEAQEITKRTTREILAIKKEKGINAALASIGYDAPLYRIDTTLALDFAYDYQEIEDKTTQLNLLSAVGIFLSDEKLSTKLTERLVKYRTDYLRDKKFIPVIDRNLFYALANQPGRSRDQLKNEFLFWKEVMDSLSKPVNGDSAYVEKIKQSYACSEYNTFMIAWTLYKLKDPVFSPDFVNRLTPNNKFKVEKIRSKKNNYRRNDTLALINRYDSLSAVDFLKEPAFKKIIGTLPASLQYSISLIYNSNAGIVIFDSWFNWETTSGKPYKRIYSGKMFKIEFYPPRKAIITWVYGYIS